MNAWPFVLAAWGLVAAVTAALSFASWWTMRRAEAAADALKRR